MGLCVGTQYLVLSVLFSFLLFRYFFPMIDSPNLQNFEDLKSKAGALKLSALIFVGTFILRGVFLIMTGYTVFSRVFDGFTVWEGYLVFSTVSEFPNMFAIYYLHFKYLIAKKEPSTSQVPKK